jgi:succinyl-CoA synthetase alpha subunit
VFVNIFGGILRCDVLASGVVNAAKELQFKVPVVIRMEGTNVQQGQEILATPASISPLPRNERRRRKSRRSGRRCAVSVLSIRSTRVIVQGLTGREGSFHAQQMIAIRHEGRRRRHARQRRHEASRRSGFRHRRDAVRETGANASVIFVPPPFAADAILEAVRRRTSARHLHHRRNSHARHGPRGRRAEKFETRLIGPNCPGIISPGKCKIGIMPGSIHKQGHVGLVSRSGTLTYEAVDQLTRLGIGQSTCIGIGGDPIIGTTFLDAIKLFNDDPDTTPSS